MSKTKKFLKKKTKTIKKKMNGGGGNFSKTIPGNVSIIPEPIELFEAIKEGQTEKAINLINGGVDVNAIDREDWHTPLHFACKEGSKLEVVKALIDKGANVNAVGSEGTPLHLAKDTDIIKLLINNGANVNAGGKNGRTPLHLAKDTDIINLLINKGADVNAREVDRKATGFTPLHDACSNGHTKAAKLLIDKGADVNAAGGYKGETPLHIALFPVQGISLGLALNRNLIKTLIDKGADINAKDIFGDTPLHLVCRAMSDRHLTEEEKEEYFNAAIYFSSKDADIGIKNRSGRTPLDYVINQTKKQQIIDNSSIKYRKKTRMEHVLHQAFDVMDEKYFNRDLYGPQLTIGEYYGVPRGGKSMNKKRRKTKRKRK